MFSRRDCSLLGSGREAKNGRKKKRDQRVERYAGALHRARALQEAPERYAGAIRSPGALRDCVQTRERDTEKQCAQKLPVRKFKKKIYKTK